MNLYPVVLVSAETGGVDDAAGAPAGTVVDGVAPTTGGLAVVSVVEVAVGWPVGTGIRTGRVVGSGCVVLADVVEGCPAPDAAEQPANVRSASRRTDSHDILRALRRGARLTLISVASVVSRSSAPHCPLPSSPTSSGPRVTAARARIARRFGRRTGGHFGGRRSGAGSRQVQRLMVERLRNCRGRPGRFPRPSQVRRIAAARLHVVGRCPPANYPSRPVLATVRLVKALCFRVDLDRRLPVVGSGPRREVSGRRPCGAR